MRENEHENKQPAEQGKPQQPL
ncbi:unnamed protein product, partial [Allacma fusca]